MPSRKALLLAIRKKKMKNKIEEIKRYFEMTAVYFKFTDDRNALIQLEQLQKNVIDCLPH